MKPLITLALLGGIVTLCVAQTPDKEREKQIRKDQKTLNQYGVPLLLPAKNPGGPTLGESKLADFETTANGWLEKRSDPKAPHLIYVNIKNKSKNAWKNVVVQFSIFDNDRNYLGNETGPFVGTFAPGEEKKGRWGPIPEKIAFFKVIGLTGDKVKKL